MRETIDSLRGHLQKFEQGLRSRDTIGTTVAGNPKALAGLASALIKGNLRQDIVDGHLMPWIKTRAALNGWLRAQLLGIELPELPQLENLISERDRLVHRSEPKVISHVMLDESARRKARVVNPQRVSLSASDHIEWTQLTHDEFEFVERLNALLRHLKAESDLALTEGRVLAVESASSGDRMLLAAPIQSPAAPGQDSQHLFLPLGAIDDRWLASILADRTTTNAKSITSSKRGRPAGSGFHDLDRKFVAEGVALVQGGKAATASEAARLLLHTYGSEVPGYGHWDSKHARLRKGIKRALDGEK